MSLIARIQDETGLLAETVSKAAGSLLGALRLSLDAASFEPIAKAVPDYNALMSGSGAALAGRTGEIFALRSELRTAVGAGAFLGHIQDSAGPEAVGKLRETPPGLAALFS